MEVVIFLVWLFSKNLTVQSGLNIGEQHWWPLAGNTTHLLWHMTHYKVSVAITVWKTVTKTQDIFFPTAGAIKHVEYTCKLGSVHTLQQVFGSVLCAMSSI